MTGQTDTDTEKILITLNFLLLAKWLQNIGTSDTVHLMNVRHLKPITARAEVWANSEQGCKIHASFLCVDYYSVITVG